MPPPDDHLHALEQELALLQGQLTTHKRAVDNLTKTCRGMRAEFNGMNKKHTQLTRAFEGCRSDLWQASSKMDSEGATRAEERMAAVIEEQVKIQRTLPQMYKRLGEVIGARDSARESIRQCRDRAARKVEEMHRLRPCQSLTCAHCGRGGGAAALQKVKANLRDHVARIWRG